VLDRASNTQAFIEIPFHISYGLLMGIYGPPKTTLCGPDNFFAQIPLAYILEVIQE